MKAPLPADECARLQALSALQILDTPREGIYDVAVELTARLLGTPIALLSLVDHDRQWFKASHGLGDIRATPRDRSFCAHAILEPRVMVVGDATRDRRFADNPLVTAEPGIRFYAGAPLVTSGGHALGTLCAIDRQPRSLQPGQARLLTELAALLTALIEARADRARLVEARADIVERDRRLQTITDGIPAAIAYVDIDRRIAFANRAFQQLTGLDDAELHRQLREDVLEFGPEVRARMDRAFAGETVTFEFMPRQAAGRTMYVTYTPDIGPDGVRGILGFGIDISSRVRDEARRRADELRALNARLHDELEAERRRIARTLHDECAQALTAVRMRLGTLTRAGAADPAIVPLAAEVDAALERAARSMQSLVANLRPPLLDDLGLATAVRNLARQVEAQSGIAIDVTVEGDVDALPDETSTALYRILQEALTNVQRHAAAHEATVHLSAGPQHVRMAIADDGRGFDAASVDAGRYGLIGMRERALELGGHLTLDSRPDDGVTIVVELPGATP